MKKYIIGIDEGTTSVRTVIYDTRQNAIVCIKQQKINQYYPKDGYVEQDAEEIYQSLLRTLEDAFDEMKIHKEEVYSIGITNQRETVVAWDRRNGKPVCRAIVWQCRRTMEECKLLAKKYGKLIKNRTGLLVDAYFSATKMKWLLDNDKNVQKLLSENNLCFGTIDSYLTFRLSGKHITDVTNASRTMLMNIKTLEYDKDLLKIFNIPLSVLPKIVDSCGELAIAKTSIGEIPIKAIIGDQQASLFGQGCFKEGNVKCTYGTGAFVLSNTSDKLIKNPKLLTTVAWKIGDNVNYALEGSVFCAGSGIEWLKDIGLLNSSNETSIALDSHCDDLCFVPALTGLGSPYWDPMARGLLIGITRGTTKQDIVKAVVESIAFSVNDLLEEMKKNVNITKLRVDGGVSKNEYLVCFQANISNVVIERQSSSEETVLGVIYLAGLGEAFKDIEDINQIIKITSSIQPSQKNREFLLPKIEKYHNAVLRSLHWIKK